MSPTSARPGRSGGARSGPQRPRPATRAVESRARPAVGAAATLRGLAGRRARGAREGGGIAVGEAAAAAMVAARANDGRFEAVQVPDRSQPGRWRPEPPLAFGDPFAWVAQVGAVSVRHPSQFASKGPGPLAGPAYAEDLAEVQSVRSRISVERTADQTDMPLLGRPGRGDVEHHLPPARPLGG